MKFHIVVLLVFLLAIPTIAQDDDAVNPSELELSGTPTEICDAATPAIEPENRDYQAPEQVIEEGVDYRAVVCTSSGAVYIDLYEGLTPVTVNNFVFLAEQNYYNNTIFHRVLEDFMAQAGDPTGTGAGGPGYRFQDEIVSFLTFDDAGLLAMANSGPATNGSQFFITTAQTPWLNGAHTIFGEVLEGQTDTVDNLTLRDPDNLTAPVDPSDLETVVIIRDPELVETTFEDEAEVATAETFTERLDVFLGDPSLPEDIVFEGSQILDTEAVSANAPEDLQADYADFLESNNHEYRVTATLDTPDCNETYFFYTMSYSVDAFASEVDATNALNNDFLPEYYASVGYEPSAQNSDAPYAPNAYIAEQEICDTTVQIVTLDVQRGRYIANISVLLNALEANNPAPEGRAQAALGLFESALGDAYRSELR